MITPHHHKFIVGAQWLSGRVLKLTRDRGAPGSSLAGVTALSLSKNITPSLGLVQPRKIRPFVTERLLMGRIESNQTNKFIVANLLISEMGKGRIKNCSLKNNS